MGVYANNIQKCIPKMLRCVYNLIIIGVVSYIMSIGSLYFSTGDFGLEMFQSYFRNIYIVLLNTIPIFICVLLFWVMCNQLWISISFVSIVLIILSLVNYFKILFRDDPLLMEDLSLFFEMKDMTNRYKIHINADMILWFLVTLSIIFVTWRMRTVIKTHMNIKKRLFITVVIILGGVFFMRNLVLNSIYYQKTENIALINRWGSTQQFISRGFVYPFLYSSNNIKMDKPDGYNVESVKIEIEKIREDDIPKDMQVNIVAIMLEAYADFSIYPQIEFNPENDPYTAFKRLKDLSYHGQLLTDIFAGGTVRTERQFVTGADSYPNFRKDTYSYARYFTNQGYRVEGSHPCYEWFYNRLNVNEYLGFTKYDFYETRYGELANGEIAGDDILFSELYKDLNNSINDEIPYFNFSVTYQNHGPYSTDKMFETPYVLKKNDYTEGEYNILNNYMMGINNTGEELEELIDSINSLNEPCVVVCFGDHKPWLGEDNSVYKMLGIDLNVSTLEGFYNYYATPYIIFANDSAKKLTENQFIGEGPDIAPNYLMNELFAQLGYDGPAFMKITNSVRDTITAHSGNVFMENGNIVEKLSDEDQKIWNQYKIYEYYYMNQK